MPNQSPWYDSDNPTTVVRGASWRLGIWIIVVVVFCSMVGAIVWGINVLAADPKGRGDAYRQKESANNRIFSQQYFQQQSQEVTATQAKIRTLGALKERTDEQATRYEGLQNYCADVVAKYNAAARSYTTQDFRDVDLPESYDPTNDCEYRP